MACLAFGRTNGNDVVPTKRLLIASGYDPNAPNLATIWPLAGTNTWNAAPSSGSLTVRVASALIQPPLQPPPAAPGYRPSFATPTAPKAAFPTPIAPVADFAMYVRAANAVGMMLFGVLGIVVGLFAFKRVSQANRGD